MIVWSCANVTKLELTYWTGETKWLMGNVDMHGSPGKCQAGKLQESRKTLQQDIDNRLSEYFNSGKK